MKRVAVLGTGLMGAAMARNLAARSWQVQAFDVVPQKTQDLQPFGISAHANAGDAAMNCVAAVVAVVNAAQCEAVLFGPQGAVQGLPAGACVLLCPTLAPHETEALAQRLADCGLQALDAPMSGGPARALDGSMSLMVAGPEPTQQQCEALLQALSSRVFRISPRWGDGARTKLVNNLLAGINLVGAAEAMGLAAHLGLNLTTTLAVVADSSGQSWIGSDRMARALAGDWAPRAHMSLLEKDTRLALQAAQTAGFTGLLGPLAAQAFAQASAQGLADCDDAALLQRFLPT